VRGKKNKKGDSLTRKGEGQSARSAGWGDKSGKRREGKGTGFKKGAWGRGEPPSWFGGPGGKGKKLSEGQRGNWRWGGKKPGPNKLKGRSTI